MDSGRVVICDDNVTAESRHGSLALDRVYERPESVKDLAIILSRIVDLDVPAAELDLWHGRDARHVIAKLRAGSGQTQLNLFGQCFLEHSGEKLPG